MQPVKSSRESKYCSRLCSDFMAFKASETMLITKSAPDPGLWPPSSSDSGHGKTSKARSRLYIKASAVICKSSNIESQWTDFLLPKGECQQTLVYNCHVRLESAAY